MPTASSRRLARRLAVTAFVAAALGAGGVGVAAAATSNGSPSASHSASASPSASASHRAGSSSGRANGPGRQGRAHHCPNMGSGSHSTAQGASPATG